MSVEAAHRDGHAFGEIEQPRPLGTELTGRLSRRRRFVVQPIAKRGEIRVEPRQEHLGGQPAPPGRIHRLVPGGADRADDLSGIVHAREQRRNVVGELDPARRRVEHIRRHLQAAPDLRPPPFRGVDAADRREVLGRVTFGELGDLGRFRRRRVILPEPRLRRQVVPPARIECQRPGVAIDRKRRRSGRVDADADDPSARESGRAFSRRQRALHRGAQAVDVVGWVLPRKVGIGGLEQHATIAARIVEHLRAERASILAVDDDGADRVGAEVDADGEGWERQAVQLYTAVSRVGSPPLPRRVSNPVTVGRSQLLRGGFHAWSVDFSTFVTAQLSGTCGIFVALLYGAGLGQQECLELRVKDIDFRPTAACCSPGQGPEGSADQVVTSGGLEG